MDRACGLIQEAIDAEKPGFETHKGDLYRGARLKMEDGTVLTIKDFMVTESGTVMVIFKTKDAPHLPLPLANVRGNIWGRLLVVL
jgi:hypothetical protein